MTRESLNTKIRRDVDEEADNILGELSRLMSPALRTRAEQVAAIARVLKFPVPAPIAWMLDLSDVETVQPAPKEYPPGTEGVIARLADEEGISVDLARSLLVDALRSDGEQVLRGRAAREAERVAEPEPERTSNSAGIPEQQPPLVTPEARIGDVAVAVEDAVTRAEEVDVPVVRRTTQPPPASVSVRPGTTQRTGPAARPRLDVEHVTVKSKAAPKPVATKPAAKAKPAATNARTEPVPEHLRRMPAAVSGAPVSVRIKASTGQLQVYEAIRDNPALIGPELADITGLSKVAIGNYSRNLIDAGLVKHTGVERLKKGVTSGRAGKELVLAETTVPPTKAHPRESGTGDTGAASASTARASEKELDDAAATSGSDLSGAELLAAHRDYAVSMEDKGPFTPVQAADAVGVPVIASELMLSLLAESARGAVVLDVGAPGIKAYEYNKMRPGAAGMGGAALRDREAAKSRGASNGTANPPVEGTGRHWIDQFSATAEVKRLVRMAERKWPGSASKRGSQHIMIKPPGHQPITIGANSKGNALRKDQTNLARAGLQGAVA